MGLLGVTLECPNGPALLILSSELSGGVMNGTTAIGFKDGQKTSLSAFPISLVLFFERFGELGFFCFQLVRAVFLPPYEGKEFARQLDELGSKSLPLVALAGAAT